MSIALDEAQKAFAQQEVPVGCVVTDTQGKIISKAFNLKEQNSYACDHAELLAINEASQTVGGWRLSGCSIYVTLEPCPMCLSAIVQSRFKNLYFGAYDPKGGAISLGYNLHNDERLNHKVEVVGGIQHLNCGKLLSDFFKAKRKSYSR